MHAMLARLQGAQKVLVLDNHPARLEMARRFDLDAAILVQAGGTHREEVRALTGGLGPEVVTPRCARAR
jgi:threonine dehydrogenase-like Zn-dependent dehydrogenase